MKIKIMLILLFATIGYNAQSQSDTTRVSERTVTWKSSAYIDQLTNDRVEVVNTFIFRKSKSIEWIQSDENGHQVFSIKNMDNQWNRLYEDGFIEYIFNYHNGEGKIFIQRKEGRLTLALEITGLQSGPLSLLFEIDKATY